MTIHLRFKASSPQTEFVNAQDDFPAMVAGFGAGKTAAAVLRTLKLKLEEPTLDVAYYLPTYDLVRRIGYPRFSDVLSRSGMAYKLNKSEHTLTIAGKGSIIFRTLDNPDRIVGYEVADSVVDELDTLKKLDAEHCWRQIIARNRQKKRSGKRNTVAVSTTPEGYRFVYDRWERNPEAGYRIIRASTYSNARNLPDGYIDGLRRSYPPQLIEAYLEGKFVNMTGGAVYSNFDRRLNHSDVTMMANEPLHIGMDFNVLNMTATVNVVREGLPITVAELTGVRDTPTMVRMLKERYADHVTTIYPDASGQNTSSKNASESDLSIIRQGGFAVRVDSRNPAVKDRVNAMCGMILNELGERRWLINTDACPITTEALEQQAYDKNGEPDKTSGHDHPVDAQGYFIASRYPITRNSVIVTPIRM